MNPYERIVFEQGAKYSNNKTPPGYYISRGFVAVLALLFIALKLVGTVDWSWWWVTSPLWGSFGLWLVITFFVYFVQEYRRQ